LLGKFWKLYAAVVLFWVLCLEAAWLLAELYMPLVKTWTSGELGALTSDILVWLGVLFTLAVILIFFRRFFHALFWYELSLGEEKRGKQRFSQ
jgi:hypothetical protein